MRTAARVRIGTLEVEARHALAAALLLAANVAALWWMGQDWWCAEGDWRPWSLDVWSPHNSQHLIDPYTVTHVMHGVAAYACGSATGCC